MQAKITITLLGLLSIIVLGCMPAAPTQVTQPVTPAAQVETDYVGRVVDANTLRPIANAKVTLYIEGVPPIAFTDDEGVYRFRLLIPSRINAIIRVDAAGYPAYTRNITIPSEIPIEDIRLTSQQVTSEAEILPTVSSTGSIPVTQIVEGPTVGHPPAPTAIPTRRLNTPVPPTNPPPPTITPAQPTEINISGCIELLDQTWVLEGAGPQEEGADTVGQALKGRNYIRIRYDLHGFFALTGDASAIIFDQPDGRVWHYISLSDYGQNGQNGSQTVDIPISHFSPPLDLDQPVGWLHTRFWSDNVEYKVEVFSIQACS